MDMLMALLTGLIPVIAGAGASYLFQLVKTKVAPWIGAQSALTQQVLFAVFSTVAVFGSSALGLQLPGEAGQWTVATVNSVLMALSGMGVHAIKKALQGAANELGR